MTLLSRTSALALIVLLTLFLASLSYAIDVPTVGINNTRQGWNKFVTVLAPANVPRLRQIREFMVDEKIDVSPLIVGNKLYVFTMTNTAYIFDINTGHKSKNVSSLHHSTRPTSPTHQGWAWISTTSTTTGELRRHR